MRPFMETASELLGSEMEPVEILVTQPDRQPVSSTGRSTGEIYQYLTGPWPAGWPAKFTIFNFFAMPNRKDNSKEACIHVHSEP